MAASFQLADFVVAAASRCWINIAMSGKFRDRASCRQNLPPHRCGLAVAIIAIFVGGASAQEIDFAHDIVPILKARCIECHSNGKYKGSVSFDIATDAIKKSDRPRQRSRRQQVDPAASSRPTPTNGCRRKGPPLSAVEDREADPLDRPGAKWEEGFTFKKLDLYVAPLKLKVVAMPPHGPLHPPTT